MKLLFESWRRFIAEAKNEDGKEQGVDGKACWKGYKHAGTEDGKDKCVKMEEDDVRDTYGSEVEDRNKRDREKGMKDLMEEEFYEVDALDENEEYCPVCVEEAKKKKACKPSKGKRFAKRVDGKCRSFGQAGQAKGGGDRIRPGTAKGDAYCARSAGIKKCKNPPCANTLSRKKWKCKGKKSIAEDMVDEGHGLTKKDIGTVEDTIDILKFITKSNVKVSKRKDLSKGKK